MPTAVVHFLLPVPRGKLLLCSFYFLVFLCVARAIHKSCPKCAQRVRICCCMPFLRCHGVSQLPMEAALPSLKVRPKRQELTASHAVSLKEWVSNSSWIGQALQVGREKKEERQGVD